VAAPPFFLDEKGDVMDLFQGLNDAQQEAVACLEGPLLIVAGAGSGKTRVLTYRIAKEVGSGKGNGYYPAVVAQVGSFCCVVIIGDAHRTAAISSCSGAQPLGNAGSSVFAIYYQKRSR